MFTKIIGFDLNIYVSTGPRTAEYKQVLAAEIKAQSLDYILIEDLSSTNDINAIIYSDDSDISDFSIFSDKSLIFL